MDQKYDQMVQDHNNQSWEVEDSANLDQCFDLALGWCDILGVPREAIRHLDASQIWTQPLDVTLQYFDYIPNTPNGVPPKGAIVVFNGKVGHVSAASGQGDNNNFVSFDQNWDTANFHDTSGKPICRFVTHDYGLVLGWLVFKEVAQSPVSGPVYSQDQAVDDIYQGLCGTHPSDDEKKSRAEQLANGKSIVNIITDVCNGDVRFRDLYITPAINQAISDFQKTQPQIQIDPGIPTLETASITAPTREVNPIVQPEQPAQLPAKNTGLWGIIVNFFKSFNKPH